MTKVTAEIKFQMVQINLGKSTTKQDVTFN